MEIRVTPAPPPPPPSRTFDLLGLTEDEALFLRDLTGRFSCIYARGDIPHPHSALYSKLRTALGDTDLTYHFRTNVDNNPVLRCWEM